MIRIPSFELSNLNAFNFREYEWDSNTIIDVIKSILQNSEKYNVTVKNVSIEEKQDKNSSNEIRKTLSKILKIDLVYHSGDTSIDIPLDYELPWLINNHFYIGGNYKVAIYQLYDKPIINVQKKNIVKIKTTLFQSFNVEKKKPTKKNKIYFEAQFFNKKFPYVYLLIAKHGVDWCKQTFQLDDSFEYIEGTDYDNKSEEMQLVRSDMKQVLTNVGLDLTKLFKNDFPKLTDTEFVQNIDLITDLDIFTRRYLSTGNIIDEFLSIFENGTYDDSDYCNKRLRFSEQVIYCWIIKDLYSLFNQIKTKSIKKLRFNINNKVILQNANVSSIVQFDTCINPLYELAILSRTSLSGPGGFKKENVPTNMRDIHSSMLHIIDPSDTGDRDGCGTIQYIVPSAKFKEDGCLESAGDNSPVNSVATSFVPLCEHDDPVRLQMSSSQQRHAVMLQNFDSAIVQSGIEGMYSNYTSFLYTAKDDGTVIYKNKDIVIVKYNNGTFQTLHVGYRKLYISVLDFYHVYYNVGDTFKKGDIIAESNFMKSGKICLGKNLRVCITPYYGLNYEDAIVLSERVRREKMFTSVHYKEIVIEVPKNKVLLNITDNKDTYKVIPNIGDHVKRGEVIAKLKTIDKERFPSVIFEKCSDVKSDEDGEVIDVKVYANKWNTDFEQFNDFVKSSIAKNKIERDNLVKEVSEYLNSDELEQLVSTLDINKSEKNNYKYKGDVIDGVRIELTLKYDRDLQIGDKLANRHGNKGTISKFVPDELMPINQEDGTRADIVINPLGIISRMNVGQVFECHLSEAVMNLRKKCLADLHPESGNDPDVDSVKKYINGFIDIIDCTENKTYSKQAKEIINGLGYNQLCSLINNFTVIQPPFQSIGTNELQKAMEYTNTKYEVRVFDPVCKKEIKNDLVFGWLYYMKLNHISQDKIAYRGIGPYSAKTNQPLCGKSRKGGQRLGEMEIWAVIAHGDEKNLNEFITTKSDSIQLRNKYISHCIGNEELLADQDDDRVPQSLRLLESCLKSVGIDFKINSNETSNNEDENVIDTDPILDDLMQDEDMEVFDDTNDNYDNDDKE